MTIDICLIFFFYIWISSFPNTISWRFNLLSHICFEYPFQIWDGCIYRFSCLGIQFCSMGLHVSFCTSTLLVFWYISITYLKILNGTTISIILLLGIMLVIQYLLWFYINFRILFFCFYEKWDDDFSSGCIESANGLWYNDDFCTFNSTNLWAWYVFLFSNIVFHIFIQKFKVFTVEVFDLLGLVYS